MTSPTAWWLNLNFKFSTKKNQTRCYAMNKFTIASLLPFIFSPLVRSTSASLLLFLNNPFTLSLSSERITNKSPAHCTLFSAKMSDAVALKTVVIPSQQLHDSVLIFLHGSGDSGEGIAEALKAANFSFPKTKIICPTAPFRKYSLYGDQGSN